MKYQQRKNHTLFFIFFAFAFQSCSWFTTVKRYKQINNTVRESDRDLQETPLGKGEQLKVSMKLSETKIQSNEDKPVYKSLWDLNAQGQAAFIEAFDRRIKPTDSLLDFWQTKYLQDEDKSPIINLVSKKVRIVFTASKWHPYEKFNSGENFLADRIEYLRFTLSLNGNLAKFTGWNKYTTEYGSIDIADLTFTKSITLNGSLGSAATKTNDTKTGTDDVNYKDASQSTSLTPSVSASGSLSQSEVQKLRYRYIQLNGSITPQSLELESEGSREVDLSGNMIVDVDMDFVPSAEIVFSNNIWQDEKKKFLDPDKIELVTNKALIPLQTGIKNLTATLTYTYAYRHVKKGVKTFYEWDDHIQYYTGTIKQPVELQTSKEILPPFYAIIKTGDKLEPNNFIKIKNEHLAIFPETNLVFKDETKASDFIRWLLNYQCPEANMNKPIVFKNQFKLTYKGKDLTMRDVQQIKSQLIPVQEYQF